MLNPPFKSILPDTDASTHADVAPDNDNADTGGGRRVMLWLCMNDKGGWGC